MGAAGPSVNRRPYQKPQLRHYGDIREITENVSNTGIKNDGAGTGKTKT